LVQIGGTFTPNQQEQIRRLAISDAIVQLRGLDRSTIAEHYRRAALVLQPSEAEGFGLPVIEALACGAPVLASDIPALREAGGNAVRFCAVGDLPSWTAAVRAHLADPASAPTPAIRLSQAARFSWHEHARTIFDAYRTRLRD
jgi:glycosyltransferase involved in cell wall biosynthesis